MKFLMFICIWMLGANMLYSVGLILPTPVALAILVGAVFADTTTTYLCLRNGGKESNPLVAFLFKRVGFWGGVAVVYCMLAVFIYFVWMKSAPAIQTVVAFLYWLVPVNNWDVYKMLKRKQNA